MPQIPTSPANNNTPRIIGDAEPGSKIYLYTDATCSSPVAGSGYAAVFASSGIYVSVSDNTTTTFWGAATDAAGNTSSCSVSGITYVEDSTGSPTDAWTQLAYVKPLTASSAPGGNYLNSNTHAEFDYPTLVVRDSLSGLHVYRDVDGNHDFSDGVVVQFFPNQTSSGIRGTFALDGDTLLISEPGHDCAQGDFNCGLIRIYEWDDLSWTWVDTGYSITNINKYQRLGDSGIALDIGANYKTIVVTTRESGEEGQVHIYKIPASASWASISSDGSRRSTPSMDMAGCGLCATVTVSGATLHLGSNSSSYASRAIRLISDDDIIVLGDMGYNDSDGRLTVLQDRDGNNDWGSSTGPDGGVTVHHLTPSNASGLSLGIGGTPPFAKLPSGAYRVATGVYRWDNPLAVNSGAVWVFTSPVGGWTADASEDADGFIEASDLNTELNFGTSLDLSHDGANLYVGALEYVGSESCSAYGGSFGGKVYHLSYSSGWNEIQSFRGSNTECVDGNSDWFGRQVLYDRSDTDGTEMLMIGARLEDGPKSDSTSAGPADPGADADTNDDLGAVYQFNLTASSGQGAGGSIDENRFLRGDCNGDGKVDVADVCTLGWLFLSETTGCVAATNANGDHAVDLSDVVTLLNFLFLGGSSPVEPFPLCGPGTLAVDRALGCEAPPADCR